MAAAQNGRENAAEPREKPEEEVKEDGKPEKSKSRDPKEPSDAFGVISSHS